ncbi:type I polyketide synthase [Thiorhodovibrio frisius]|uniref:Polyketide synthase family protein n=1 Tax=Thiorhodovibrio frisius TaxID=631362 RepID=H8YZW1_9GAMM|nr:type I polyketide synthase [Thiorhodovibrio frisius]EIC22238.1 polyketide synthase family protein [Thiorhodovibrio frisius]WPL24533.1 Polyketide synthase PksN [Thiorhodovibrio frisius]
MSTGPTKAPDIAIIGLSGIFPGSANTRAFWNNILAKRDLIADAPEEWSRPWYDPSSAQTGLDAARIRTRKVGLIGDLATFNPLEFGIPPNSIEGDPAHFMALQLAGDALRDADYYQRPFNRERTGVIVGHGSSPNRGDILGTQYGMILDQTLSIIEKIMPELDADRIDYLRSELKRSLPNLEVEHAPTLVSNVISGRISNRLDLMGPSYLVDSACSSSLIALDLGIQDLRSGRCDMVLVGGVQASMPAQIYMLFQLLGALAETDIRPFDARANGTLLGEGAGFAVIKRLADAVRDDDRIYAIVKGVGVASDGKAMGLLAPRLEGEVMAIRRAYQQTGVSFESIGLIEAHGTGIPLGDRTEIAALRQVFGSRRGRLPSCALGSVKSMIGHCIPAAGMASLIKISMALHEKILPPTLCEEINPELGLSQTPFYINTETRPWVHGGSLPRRAGINAFGFGGINSHAILEEDRPPTPLPPPGLGRWLLRDQQRTEAMRAAGPVTRAGSGRWPSELVLLAAQSRDGVLVQIDAMLDRLKRSSQPDLPALAKECWDNIGEGPARAAVIASDTSDLRAKLEQLQNKLPGLKKANLSSRQGIYYAEREQPMGRVAFMFTSEGAQYPNMLADLAVHIPSIRRWFDFLDHVYPREPPPSNFVFPPPTTLNKADSDWALDRLYAGDLAPESVSMASHAMYELLRDLGLTCDVMIGHSAGEHIALIASGRSQILSAEQFRDELRAMNQLHQQMESTGLLQTGHLLSVGALSQEALTEILDEFHDSVYLVADNCANQALVFVADGVTDGVTGGNYETVYARIADLGGIIAKLPFDRPYHTPLFAEGAAAIREFYAKHVAVGQGDISIYSCSTAAPYPADDQAILDTAAEQWTKPVRFRETIEALYRDGVRLFVEVGASNSLTAFVDNILKDRDHIAVSTNTRGSAALGQLQRMLGQLFVEGLPLALDPLYADRMKTGAQGTDSGTSSIQLRSELPQLSVDEQLAQNIRAWRTDIDCQKNQKNPPETPTPACFSQASQPDDQVSASDVALRQHFKLMQQFLTGQERIIDALRHHPDFKLNKERNSPDLANHTRKD